ncbi:hypothetical protein ElyMa_000150500 [Elysia marginata]|uniref:Uncharacterized protein n=1 Tax=Elysia marginata TaxID=1093978 RepID=A0AAV4EST4_9GAST|nr:hypothetical protein ElyMa_000150500 [Elysia marginata]
MPHKPVLFSVPSLPAYPFEVVVTLGQRDTEKNSRGGKKKTTWVVRSHYLTKQPGPNSNTEIGRGRQKAQMTGKVLDSQLEGVNKTRQSHTLTRFAEDRPAWCLLSCSVPTMSLLHPSIKGLIE